jgi:pheromone a factor receptor
MPRFAYLFILLINSVSVTRLDVCGTIALPASCLRLAMHLESVASMRKASMTYADKKRRMYIDVVICFIIPFLYLALCELFDGFCNSSRSNLFEVYIVQGHRFDIVEGIGCRVEDYASIPEFFIVWFLPIMLSLATLAFACKHFMYLTSGTFLICVNIQLCRPVISSNAVPCLFGILPTQILG